MHRHSITALATLALALVGFLEGPGVRAQVSQQAVRPSASKLTKELESALWWLPEDTEAVIVAQGPFNVVNLENEEGLLRGTLEIARFVQRWFSSALHGLFEEPLNEEGAKMLFDRPVALALQGGRRFRPFVPGSMHVEGAWILIFQNDLDVAGRAWMDRRRAALPGTRTETVSGSQVVFQALPKESAEFVLCFAQPKPNILVCATNRSYLEGVLERMAHRATTRALPAHLREWEQLDTAAKIWALRHYDAKENALDITSPLVTRKREEVQVDRIFPDDQAVGFVFWSDSENSRANVRYLSPNRDAVKIARNMWSIGNEGPQLECTLRREQQGVVSVTIPVESAEALNGEPAKPGSDEVRLPSKLCIVRLMWAIGQPL